MVHWPILSLTYPGRLTLSMISVSSCVNGVTSIKVYTHIMSTGSLKTTNQNFKETWYDQELTMAVNLLKTI